MISYPKFNPNQVFNWNESYIGTIWFGSFRLTRFESLLADLHRPRLETFSDCRGMSRINAEYTQKNIYSQGKVSLIKKDSLNQINLHFAIRSKKSFFDLKKFLDCFISLNSKNGRTCIIWLTEIFSLI